VQAEPPEPSQASEAKPRSRWWWARSAGIGSGRKLVIRSALLTTVSAIVATVIGVTLSPGAGTAAGPAMPAAQPGQASAVGALFTIAGGKLQSHFCSGSVVDSPSGDLVLTAAHCMSGRVASQLAFVPDFYNGHAPYGIWLVSRIVVDQSWQSSTDADDDFAFLVVHRHGSKVSLEDLVGGEHVAIGAPAGATVTVAAYPADLNVQISCQNTAVAFGTTQLQFDCGGYTDGTSGGPFLVNVVGPDGPGTVIGVIGGFEQGGSTPSISYAARFGSSMETLYQTALAEAGP
jgi:V8-like Glu-specific endopeptidase